MGNKKEKLVKEIEFFFYGGKETENWWKSGGRSSVALNYTNSSEIY